MQPALIITGTDPSNEIIYLLIRHLTFAMNPPGSTRPQGTLGKPPPGNNDRSENTR